MRNAGLCSEGLLIGVARMGDGALAVQAEGDTTLAIEAEHNERDCVEGDSSEEDHDGTENWERGYAWV